MSWSSRPAPWLIALALAVQATALFVAAVSTVTPFGETWELRGYLFAVLGILPACAISAAPLARGGWPIPLGAPLTVLAVVLLPVPAALAAALAVIAGQAIAWRRISPTAAPTARFAFLGLVGLGLPLYLRAALGLDRAEPLSDEVLYPQLTSVAGLWIAVAIGLALAAGSELVRGRPFGPRSRAALLAVVTIVVAGATFTPRLPILHHEQSYVLGPILRLLDGGTALVDTYSQYGVGSLYAVMLQLAATGSSPTYAGLTLSTTIVQTVLIVGFLLLVWRITEHDAIALLAAAAGALLLLVYLPVGLPGAWPSTGILRFGPVYALMTAAVLLPGRRELEIIARVLLAAAAVWSVDALVHVGLVYLALHAPRILRDRATAGRALLAVGTTVLASVLAAWTVFVLATRLLGGSWPDPLPYLALVGRYAEGFGLLPLPAVGLWWIPALVYTGALFWALGRLSSAEDERARRVLAIAAAGIAISTYYVGRSHGNNLFHVTLPLLLLGVYALARSRRVAAPGLRRATVCTVATALAFLFWWGAREVTLTKYSYSAIGVSALSFPTSPLDAIRSALSSTGGSDEEEWRRLSAPWSTEARTAHRVALFVPAPYATGLAAAIGRANAATASDPSQDALAWAALRPVVEHEIGTLAAGDLVVSLTSPCALEPEQRGVLLILEGTYRLETVRTAPLAAGLDVVVRRVVAGLPDLRLETPCRS